jgi:hypothetical protein
MSRNIIHFPNRKGANLDKEFENLIDDMGGFVLHLKSATHKSWEELGALCDLSAGTLIKVANREYRSGPMARTFYKILRALDDRSIINHSLYVKFHGFKLSDAKKLDKALG